MFDKRPNALIQQVKAKPFEAGFKLAGSFELRCSLQNSPNAKKTFSFLHGRMNTSVCSQLNICSRCGDRS